MRRRREYVIQNSVPDRQARWPNWFAKLVCDWLDEALRDATIPRRVNVRLMCHCQWDYGLNAHGQRVAKHRRWLRDLHSGLAQYHRGRVTVRVHRRCRAYSNGDPRWQDRQRQLRWDIRSAMEQFVYLLAHELRHLTLENRLAFRTDPGARRDKWSGELDANRFGLQAVQDFRREWPTLRANYLAEQRSKRQKQAAWKVNFMLLADPAARTRDRLAAAEAKLKEWQARAKRCQTFMTKYRRRIAALERSLAKQLAAKPHDKEN